mmetsp:Transcript_1365/g.4183  ORF Transcript_1365/g.4183 Transcript_1365/m.4183 type:complete len:126 (+) Transcript_1365:2490-2867(+)
MPRASTLSRFPHDRLHAAIEEQTTRTNVRCIQALGNNAGLNEIRDDGCDGREHDAPFMKQTRARFVYTFCIARVMCAQRVDVHVRVHDGRKMATTTVTAPFLLRIFLRISSSLRRSIVYEKTNSS